MTDAREPLLDPEELARLAERARLDAQTGVKGEPRSKDISIEEDDAASARETARLSRGLTGLRFAGRAYALSQDPKGLRPLVWAAWAIEACEREVRADPRELIAAAVASVAERVFEVPGLAQKLATSDIAPVRRALAEALRPDGQGRPILHALAQDADPEVRAAAVRKVGASDPWAGAFPVAPDGHSREVLVEARAVLEEPWYRLGDDPERAVRALAPLSDALAVACWERLLTPEHVTDRAMRAWLPRLIERAGCGAVLARLIALWLRRGDASYSTGKLEEAASLPHEARARAFAELLEVLRELERAERAGAQAERYLSSDIARAAATIAPERGEARVLLETILACPIDEASSHEAHEPASEHGHATSALSEVLARWPLEGALRDALVEARRAQRPGRWANVGFMVWSALGPDEVLRERARRDLDADDGQVREAAVKALLGTQHDPTQDGSVEEAALRLYERPALRAAVIGSSAAVRAQARRDLERGELRLEEALVLLRKTPREEQTDAMWRATRALRDHALEGEERERALLGAQHLIRAGDEWDASDLAYAREVIEPALTNEHHGWLGALLASIARVDAPPSAALLAEIDARASTPEQRARLAAARKLSDALLHMDL